MDKEDKKERAGNQQAAVIARECGVNKQLVWTYFGGLDNLVEEYIRQRDFWKHAAKKQIEDLLKGPGHIRENSPAAAKPAGSSAGR